MNPYNDTPLAVYLTPAQIDFCAKKVLHLKLTNVTEYIRYVLQKEMDNFQFHTHEKFKELTKD